MAAKKALQFFRIGGGVPVSILTKTMMPGAKDVVAQTLTGCIILNAGGHVILRRLNNPTVSTCQLDPSESSHVPPGEMLKEIEIISGSDVIRIGAPTS